MLDEVTNETRSMSLAGKFIREQINKLTLNEPAKI